MADVSAGFDWKNMAAGYASSTSDIILWVVLFLSVVSLVGFVLWYMSFRHKAVFRVQTRQAAYVKEKRARVKEKHGVVYWQIFPFRLVTAPPKEAVHITKNGKYVAEARITEDNPEPQWLMDTGNNDAAFEPFTTQQRALTVHMLAEAFERRKKGWKDLLLTLTPMVLMAIIIICFLIFAGEIAAPLIKIGETNRAAADVQLRIMEQQQLITEANARLYTALTGQRVAGINQTIPSEPPLRLEAVQ